MSNKSQGLLQIEQTKITEEAPLTAAEGIATYQKMGA